MCISALLSPHTSPILRRTCSAAAALTTTLGASLCARSTSRSARTPPVAAMAARPSAVSAR